MSGKLEVGINSVVTALTHYNATKYVQIAGTMWVGWDYILTFDREVIFFWRTKWTGLRMLFIVNRYLPLLGAAWITSVLLQPQPTDHYCDIGLRVMGQVFAVVSSLVFHAMLIVILNAMYQDSRLVRYGLVALFVTTHLSASLVVAFAGKSAKYTVNPIPGLHMCTSTPRAKYIWVSWLIPIIFEIAAYVLAAKKSWFYISGAPFRHRSSLMQLLKVMLRDWSVYILFIAPAYLIMAILFALAPPTLQRVVQNLLPCWTSISGTRMMLNLKEAGTDSEAGPSAPTLNTSILHASEPLAFGSTFDDVRGHQSARMVTVTADNIVSIQ